MSFTENKVDCLQNLSSYDVLMEVSRTGEKYSRDEWVPLSRIDMAGVIFDERHARELGKLMLGEWGITQPVLLRARFKDSEKSEIEYDPLDGYHRIAGLGLVQPQKQDVTIRSVVMYGCSDSQMYDQRIVAANSVQTVKFARVCTWMTKAWSVTPWKDKITVSQAFGIAANRSSRTTLGLSKDEVEEVKMWVNDKTRQWMSNVGTIHLHLRAYDRADPELILQVRTGSFTKGELAVTPAQLGVIVEEFPNSQNPGIQKEIARFVTSHSLSTTRIQNLTYDIRKAADGKKVTADVLRNVFSSEKWINRPVDVANRKRKKGEDAVVPPIDAQPEIQVIYPNNLPKYLEGQILFYGSRMTEVLEKYKSLGIRDRDVKKANKFIESYEDSRLDANKGGVENGRDLSARIIMLGEASMFLVASYFRDKCFSCEENIRAKAKEILSVFPFSNIGNNNFNEFLNGFSTQLNQLSLEADSYVIGEILESVTDIIDASSILNQCRYADKRKLVQEISRVSSYASDYANNRIQAWVRSIKI